MKFLNRLTRRSPRIEAPPLRSLVGANSRLAVIDVETTGLYRADRVVEIAIVTLDPNGEVIDEFDTLVNPSRDVGPTWIHQITPQMVLEAPLFADIARSVASRLHGAIVVAHNLPFDTRMLTSELIGAGIDVDWGIGIDTLRATGCKLEVACGEHRIAHEQGHRALHDARATARLLQAVAGRFVHLPEPVSATPASNSPVRLVARGGTAVVHEPVPFIAELSQTIHSEPDTAPYVDLLGRAVADLKLTPTERDELAKMAVEIGLNDHQVARAHREFTRQMIDVAIADSHVSDDELDQLLRAAALLGVDSDVVRTRTDKFRGSPVTMHLEPGLTVCFTGEAAVDGRPIERSELSALAGQSGLVEKGNVTAKGCDLLVAADPQSRSGKAGSARKFGVPITSVDAFIGAIRGGKVLTATRTSDAQVALVCATCGDSWLSTRKSSKPLCAECKAASRRS